MTYYYRLAELPQDAERIHQLNYRTFVEEIPQHQSNESGLLVDAFHEENTYVVCLKEEKIVGMIALRTARPFSLDKNQHLYTLWRFGYLLWILHIGVDARFSV